MNREFSDRFVLIANLLFQNINHKELRYRSYGIKKATIKSIILKLEYSEAFGESLGTNIR